MKTETITREHIVKRNQDWVNRLNLLFDNIEGWRRRLPTETVVIRGDATQRQEELLKEFNVDPVKVPTYAILLRDKRVSFVPAGLWVIGANGRVNLTTNTTQYILVDFSEALSETADWRIVSPSSRKLHPPFDEESFRKVCLEAFGAV